MKAVILMYHRIGNTVTPDRYTVSPENFSRQMSFLSEHEYRVIGLGQLLRAFAGDSALPDRSVVVTFDDGFLETYQNAREVLSALAFSATFYVVTGLAGKKNDWMTSTGNPGSQLMDWAEIEDLARSGFEIGSHTVTHPRLTEMETRDAEAEIGDSKKALEDRLGVAMRSFAYPYGCFDRRIRDLVEATGYESACSTLSGFANSDSDAFALRRIEVFGADSLSTFRRKLQFGANEVRARDLLRYYSKRAVSRSFR